MKKTQFPEEQIAYALHEGEASTPVADICRKRGVSEQTFYRWKKMFAGMENLGDKPFEVLQIELKS